MLIKFNETGTHIKNNKLKIRLDYYPDKDSKTYIEQYIDVFARELTKEEKEMEGKGEAVTYTQNALDLQKLIPTKKQLNPFLCIFIEIDSNITKQQLIDFVKAKYEKSILQQLDSAIKDNDKGLLHKTLANKGKVSESIKPIEIDIGEINTRLSGLEVEVK